MMSYLYTAACQSLSDFTKKIFPRCCYPSQEQATIQHLPPEILDIIFEEAKSDKAVRGTCKKWSSLIEDKYQNLFLRILRRCGQEEQEKIKDIVKDEKSPFSKLCRLRKTWPMQGFDLNSSGDWANHIQKCLENRENDLEVFSETIVTHHDKLRKKHSTLAQKFNKRVQIKPDVLSHVDLFSTIEELDLRVSGLDKLPKSIKFLRSLKKLNLFGNNLRTLPEEIGSLKKLRQLDVSFNIIKSLPEALINLKSLERFDFTQNEIKKLPDSLSELKKRKQLKILPPSY